MKDILFGDHLGPWTFFGYEPIRFYKLLFVPFEPHQKGKIRDEYWVNAGHRPVFTCMV